MAEDKSNGQSSIFQIPGNVKQSLLPFVLNPKSELNTVKSNSTELATVQPQIFSYRSESIGKNNYSSGVGQLNFYPSSFKNIHFKDDISWKLLYQRDTDLYSTNNSIGITDILNNIPGIQIREFLPDTRLDQCINFCRSMFEGITSMFSDDSSSETTASTDSNSNDKKTENNESVMAKIKETSKKAFAAITYTLKYMTGSSKPHNLFTDFEKSLNDSAALDFSSYDSDWKNPGTQQYYVLTFPYRLYYCMQSCVTTNIYEVPGASSTKSILETPYGMGGWTSGGDFSSGFRISGLLSKIPGIGGMLDTLLGNIGINYMPWWSPKAGTEAAKEPEIEIKFDLYNDSAEAAETNFIFVNTIVPGNKYIQYNMFQHSQNLYDVKIEGLNRLYACAGTFSVTYEGQLRTPPRRWINDLVNAHANNCMNKEAFIANIVNNHLIKIPDVYRVTMRFQSLLPANFNNYLYNYAENANHITKYENRGYDSSPLSDALGQLIPKYVQRIKKVWAAGDEDTDTTIESDAETK